MVSPLRQRPTCSSVLERFAEADSQIAFGKVVGAIFLRKVMPLDIGVGDPQGIVAAAEVEPSLYASFGVAEDLGRVRIRVGSLRRLGLTSESLFPRLPAVAVFDRLSRCACGSRFATGFRLPPRTGPSPPTSTYQPLSSNIRDQATNSPAGSLWGCVPATGRPRHPAVWGRYHLGTGARARRPLDVRGRSPGEPKLPGRSATSSRPATHRPDSFREFARQTILFVGIYWSSLSTRSGSMPSLLSRLTNRSGPAWSESWAVAVCCSSILPLATPAFLQGLQGLALRARAEEMKPKS